MFTFVMGGGGGGGEDSPLFVCSEVLKGTLYRLHIRLLLQDTDLYKPELEHKPCTIHVCG